MIGFIVIGRNEGPKLVRCINSIQKTIDENNFDDSEIIYVDSKSTDDSIDRVMGLAGNVRVYRTTGRSGPAIGRNIGAAVSNADVYCFADGDMELVPGFFPAIFDESGKLRYPFVSGQFENVYYDGKDKRTGSELYIKSVLEKDQQQATTGGLFIIEKGLWDKIGGMDTRFKTGEDLDLGLRLAKKGHLLLRKKELLAIHHTRAYRSGTRMWKDLFAGKTLYARGLLYRKHMLIFNVYILRRIMRSDPTCVLLGLCCLITLITKMYYFPLVYLLGIIMTNLFIHKAHSPAAFLSGIAYQLVRDVLTILAFFFFFPRKARLQYEKIK